MGSGTTLLRLVLDSHERIAIPPETGFMRAEQAHKFIPFWAFGGTWQKRIGWSKAELDEHLRDFYETMFRRYAERHGKERWGEKTPWHVWHIEEMAHLFPDAVFIGIIRHPAANAASNTNRFGHTLATGARHYVRYNREIARQAAALGRRFLILRYEELVLEPEPVLRQLLARLGEPWSPTVLQHHVVHANRGRTARAEGRTRADDPLDATRISKWTSAIDEEGRELLHRRLGRLAEFYGYTVAEPLVLAPLAAPGTRIVDGEDLGRRMTGFEDLALLEPPFVPLTERPYRPSELTLVQVGSGQVSPTRPARPIVRRSLTRVLRRRSPRAYETLKAIRRMLPRHKRGSRVARR
jgi:hypothetical protein